MTWGKVILFAVIAGVYTGLIMQVPFLRNTSFYDIGVYYEWWVIFAVIVVVNCEKNLEAMMKCFVFFLISQPLVYLVRIAGGTLSADMAWYYYSRFWFPMTLLTIPGGFIAYNCKKQNVAGAIVMGMGNTIQAVSALFYYRQLLHHFPNHLLSCLVCIVSIFVMTFCIQKEKKNRIVALVTPVVLLGAILVWAELTHRVI